MKTPLKDDFYGTFENMKTFLAVGFLLAILLLIISISLLRNFLTIFMDPIMALLAVSCLKKENISTGGKHKLLFSEMNCQGLFH